MQVALLGPPGAGKGTQGRRLALMFAIPAISTGELLRQHVDAGTQLGSAASAFMSRGDLVPDELVVGMLVARLREPDAAEGWILDGFPRTLAQAETLDRLLTSRSSQLDVVINYAVPDSVVLGRLEGRRVCPSDSSVYHLQFAPPRMPHRCDLCATPLTQRKDDQAEIVIQRLGQHRQQTAPVEQHYADRGVLFEIDASQTAGEITRRTAAVLAPCSGHAGAPQNA